MYNRSPYSSLWTTTSFFLLIFRHDLFVLPWVPLWHHFRGTFFYLVSLSRSWFHYPRSVTSPFKICWLQNRLDNFKKTSLRTRILNSQFLTTSKAVFQYFFHPLSSIPNASPLSPFSRLLWALPSEYRGRITIDLPLLHEKYGLFILMFWALDFPLLPFQSPPAGVEMHSDTVRLWTR